jgi:conjugal transfer pilus assembly protein TraW
MRGDIRAQIRDGARAVLVAFLDAVTQPVALAILMVLLAMTAVADGAGSADGVRSGKGVSTTDERAAIDAAGAVANAAEGAMSRIDPRALRALVDGAAAPGASQMDAASAIAARAGQVLQRDLEARGVDPAASDDGPRYVVFATQAMDDGALAAIDARAAARGDMMIAFRGLAPGQRLSDFANARLRGGEAAPAVIDSRLYRAHAIDAAPAVLDRLTGRVVFGSADPDVFETAADRERVAPVVAILEPDLAAVMAERAAGIDWAAKARAAVGRFWDHAPMVALTPAPEDAARIVDARVTLARDFTLPDGRVLAKAGHVVDPTAHLPFTLTLIVFDGRSEAELPLVAAEAAAAMRPVLMVTELDRLDGWEALRAIEARLGRPVYLMPREIAERFRLRHTVSVVTGGEGVFHVRERARPSLVATEG